MASDSTDGSWLMDMVGIWDAVAIEDDRPSKEDIGYSQGKWEAKLMVMMAGKEGQLDKRRLSWGT